MDEKPKRVAWPKWLAISVALLIAYPASLGPLQMIIVNYRLPATFYAFHTPLIWLIRLDRSNYYCGLYWNYLNWWIGV